MGDIVFFFFVILTHFFFKLQILSSFRNLEESQALEARHQAEVSKLRALIQQQKKEYDDVTSHMRELAEAQWNTVNRVHHPSGKGVGPRGGRSVHRVQERKKKEIIKKTFSQSGF